VLELELKPLLKSELKLELDLELQLEHCDMVDNHKKHL